jgi:uncharacterized protein YggE
MSSSIQPQSVPTWLKVALPLALGLPLIISVAGVMLPRPVSAQEQQFVRSLTVTGTGDIEIPTTHTDVRLGVEVQGRTAQAAQEQAAQQSSQLVEFLRSRNLENLQTTGISLNPRYNYDGGQSTIIGYTATNTVSFRVATEDIGDLLDRAVESGATRIDGISFTATEEAIATAQEDALQEATERAQSQADAVLSSLGLSRQEIIGIQINGATPIMPQPIAMQAAEFDRAASTPVIGGDQTVQSSVTLQIRY